MLQLATVKTTTTAIGLASSPGRVKERNTSFVPSHGLGRGYNWPYSKLCPTDTAMADSQMHPTILSSYMEGTTLGLSFVPHGPVFSFMLNGS